jgi:hypothetical protein
MEGREVYPCAVLHKSEHQNDSLTPRLFASIQQPVTNAASTTQQTSQYLPDLTLEYQLTDTLMLRALNNQQSLQLNLLFEYAY